MLRLLRCAFVIALLAVLAPARAQDIRPWQLSKAQRIVQVGPYTMAIPSASAGTDITAGVNGVVAAMLIRSTTFPVWTSSIAVFPYPCKLDVKVHDDSNADTLSCSSVKITGLDQFDQAVVETVIPSGETASETVHVFASASRIEAAQCTPGGGSDNDVVRVSCSAEIGFPYRVTAKTNLIKLRLWDVSATTLYLFKPASLTIDMTNYSVETDDLTPTLGQGDVVTFYLLLDKKS